MRVAAVDIGTNSVKLLIVSNGRTVDERVVVTRLGEGVERTGRISGRAMDRTLEALVWFREIARKRKAWDLRVVGTRVLRMARNAREFVRRCREELDLPVRILSGAEEARLGYLGATGGARGVAVLDVGGGSAQFIVDGRGRSAAVGAVVVTESHLRSDPPAPDEIAKARRHVRARAAKLVRKAPKLVGIGGTIATAAAIREGRVHGVRLRLGDIDELLARLAAMPLEDRKRVKGLDPARADIIVAGLLIVGEILRAGGFGELLVSGHGLRHGLALEMASKL